MIIKNERGNITVSNEVIAAIVGNVAVGCFGVKGMTFKNVADGIVRLLRRDHMSKGVTVIEKDNGCADVELHIAVNNGVNIPAACESIINQVKYNVEKLTGVTIESVIVCVDTIKAE